MVAEHVLVLFTIRIRCSLAKISMVAEQYLTTQAAPNGCSLAKISMVAERRRKRTM